VDVHRKLTIFISYPSDLLTDFRPHGDGLLAFEFINRLAQRGHTLHVVCQSVEIQGKLPETVKLYSSLSPISSPILSRVRFLIRSRQLFNRLYRDRKVDIIHELNPIVKGLSFSFLGTEVPVVLGPFHPQWPDDAEVLPYRRPAAAASASFFSKTSLKHLVFSQQQRQADALLLSTQAALTTLGNVSENTDKAYDLPPGVDDIFFSPNSSEVNSAPETPTILFLANLEVRKGIFTLLDAFEHVAEVLPSCRLIIAGSGTQLDQTQQRVSRMSCQSQITLLGKIERTQIPETMRQCTVYCLPSYGEPFGLTALEAMACGKPIVVTNAGGLAYLIPEQGGYRVPPRNSQALAEALLKILSTPELQIQMGYYNRKLVERVYSWERVIEKLESIYYKLI
jgi:glycosyltransferase involved in cell wall biosynthesis